MSERKLATITVQPNLYGAFEADIELDKGRVRFVDETENTPHVGSFEIDDLTITIESYGDDDPHIVIVLTRNVAPSVSDVFNAWLDQVEWDNIDPLEGNNE